MKIGLYTHHQEYNFGAMLQAFATQRILEALGHEVEVVFVRTNANEKTNEFKNLPGNLKELARFLFARFHPSIQKRFKNYRSFHSKLNLSVRYRTDEELRNSPPKYDVHLVGSDQVWNLEKGFIKERYHFLEFLPDEACRISFASSLGSSNVDSSLRPELGERLSKFYALSTRESEGAEILRQVTGRPVNDVLDPTLLLTKQEWNEVSRDPKISGKYILCYGFDNTPRSREMLGAIRSKLGMKLVFISTSLFCPHDVDVFLRAPGPAEFIGLIKSSEYVFSASYHGIVFAIIYRKNFLGPIHPTRNMRMNSLLNKIGMADRQIQDASAIQEMPDSDISIDYSRHEKQIQICIEESKVWLSSTLLAAQAR